MNKVFDMAITLVSLKHNSRRETIQSVRLLDHAAETHTNEGGCGHCTGVNTGGCELDCVTLQINRGETGVLHSVRSEGQASQPKGGVEMGAGMGSRRVWMMAKCDNESCSFESDIADTTAQSCKGQGSGRGHSPASPVWMHSPTEKEDTQGALRQRANAFERLREAGTKELLVWIARCMTDDLGIRILQVVAGEGITGAQVAEAV